MNAIFPEKWTRHTGGVGDGVWNNWTVVSFPTLTRPVSMIRSHTTTPLSIATARERAGSEQQDSYTVTLQASPNPTVTLERPCRHKMSPVMKRSVFNFYKVAREER